LLDEHGLEGVTLRDPGWIGTLRAGRRIAASYQARRVFLVGSAAHTHGPAGAQDFNLGVQDAHNLAWKIGLLSRGKVRDALLDSYTDERRPVAAATLEGSDAALKAIAAKVRVPREARDALLRLLTSLEPVQRRLAADLEELDLSYRKSAIVSESIREQDAPVAGARLQDHRSRGPEHAGRARLLRPRPGIGPRMSSSVQPGSGSSR
jgi:hypothetical protein